MIINVTTLTLSSICPCSCAGYISYKDRPTSFYFTGLLHSMNVCRAAIIFIVKVTTLTETGSVMCLSRRGILYCLQDSINLLCSCFCVRVFACLCSSVFPSRNHKLVCEMWIITMSCFKVNPFMLMGFYTFIISNLRNVGH